MNMATSDAPRKVLVYLGDYVDRGPCSRETLDLILDAGPLKGGVGSTVVDVTGETPVILREGEVPKHEIVAALKSASQRIERIVEKVKYDLLQLGRIAADMDACL